jgi:hypothetical protein
MTLAPSQIPPIPFAPGWDEQREAELAGAGGVRVLARLVAESGSNGTYAPTALIDFASKVQRDTLNGFRGHPAADDLSRATPVIHWLGATFDRATNATYVRGVVDPDATDLARLIRVGRAPQISIHYANVRRGSDGGTITGVEPISLDTVPLGLGGMPSSAIVAWQTLGAGEALHMIPFEEAELVSMSTPPISQAELVQALQAHETIVQLRELLGLSPSASSEQVKAAVVKLNADVAQARTAQTTRLASELIASYQPGIPETMRPFVLQGVQSELLAASVTGVPSETEVSVSLKKVLERDEFKNVLASPPPARNSTLIHTAPPAQAGGIRYAPGRRI